VAVGAGGTAEAATAVAVGRALGPIAGIALVLAWAFLPPIARRAVALPARDVGLAAIVPLLAAGVAAVVVTGLALAEPLVPIPARAAGRVVASLLVAEIGFAVAQG